MASHEVVLAAIYSASAELRAMNFYFLLHQQVIPDPMLKQYPIVLFLMYWNSNPICVSEPTQPDVIASGVQ